MNNLPLFNEETLRKVAEELFKENKMLKEGIKKFVDKNYVGGNVADIEYYGKRVSCKDIYELRELIK